jgi:tRNA pseudouridine55 synthase
LTRPRVRGFPRRFKGGQHGTPQEGSRHLGLAGHRQAARHDLDHGRQQGSLGFRREESRSCRHARPRCDRRSGRGAWRGDETDALKAYAFTVRFGQATNTDDAEGEVVATSDLRPSDEDIRGALPGFEGDIMQVPPAFSAVKIDGQRAYAMARAGEDVELEARPLFVESLEMVARPDPDHAELEMVCGKGGYVRSVARDLGEILGCFGHVTALRRVWSGPFELEDAITLDEVEKLARTPELDQHLLPLSAGLTDLPELPTTVEGATRLRNGNPGIVISADVAYGDLAWASLQGEPVAVGVYKAGELHPSRVFLP